MKYLIWTPALRETIDNAHKLDCNTTMLGAAKKYVESINYPDSFCSVVIVECSNDWEPISDALQMNFKLIREANFDSLFKFKGYNDNY